MTARSIGYGARELETPPSQSPAICVPPSLERIGGCPCQISRGPCRQEHYTSLHCRAEGCLAIDGGAEGQDTRAPHARRRCQESRLSKGGHEVSSRQSIAELAYHLWNARGRPRGSVEED